MSQITMIVDLQYGSTGKGLLAGYLSNINGYEVCVTANMPNAGHTYIDQGGNKFVFKALPSGAASHHCRWALIGPGAIFDPARLETEYQHLTQHYGAVVGVHEAAWCLRRYHYENESAAGLEGTVGSTAAGAMAAQVEKMQRGVDNRAGQVYRPTHKGIRVLSHQEYMSIIYSPVHILAEGSQGYSLGLNAGFWPFCTSRDCTPAAFMAAMALPHTMVEKVIGTMRTFPIRVGGNSGPWYPDQKEITWTDLGVEPELTTVTGRERRVATFSRQQIRDAAIACDPTELFLNFVNYGQSLASTIIEWTDEELGVSVRYLGHGPHHDGVEEI